MLDNLKRTCYDVDTPKDSSSDRPSREHTQQAGGARADRYKPQLQPWKMSRAHDTATAGQGRSWKTSTI